MRVSEIIALLGGWSVVLVAVSAFVSHLFSERMLSSWRRREQSELETLRDRLADSRLTLEAAIHAHSAGQDLAQRKCIEAVERLWGRVLECRMRLSAPLSFTDIALPDEYDHFLVKDTVQASLLSGLSDHDLQAGLAAVESAENDRPLLGEQLWLDFFIYRAFWGRALHLTIEGVKRHHIADFRTDDGIRHLLGYVLTKERVASIFASDPPLGFLRQAGDEVEALILREIEQVLSGERSSYESFEIASKLREAANVAKKGV